jgi:hypothetical protein
VAAVFPESLFSTAGSNCPGDEHDEKKQEQDSIARFKDCYQRKTQSRTKCPRRIWQITDKPKG